MYNVITSASFEKDLDNIIKYFINSLNSKNAAVHLLDRTEEITSHISENPYMYPVYHDKKITEREYHYSVIGNFILFYTINEINKTVVLSRLLYGRRYIPEII